MKVCIWPHTMLRAIPTSASALHLARPIKQKQLKQILSKRKIKRVTMAKSTFVRLPDETVHWLEQKGMQLFIQTNPGKPIQIRLEQILDIASRVRDHQPLRDIEKHTGIPKSTVHYLVRYAKRTKAKKGRKTHFYLD